jgi:alkylhydroperoxidase family enzyme
LPPRCGGTTAKPTFPNRIGPCSISRAVGFDDVGILQITLIASWFNYINRVADALGVGKPDA